MKKRFIIVILVIALVVTMLPLAASAGRDSAGRTNVTIKSCPVWSAPSSKSKKIRTLPKGTYISIVSGKRTSTGAYWLETQNGTWVYMNNVEPSNKKAGEPGSYLTVKDNVPLRYNPTGKDKVRHRLKKGERVEIDYVTFSDTGSRWGKLTYKGKGYYVYMGNVVLLGAKVDEVVESYNGVYKSDDWLRKNYGSETCKGCMEFLVDQIYGIGDSGAYNDNKYMIDDPNFIVLKKLLRKDGEITDSMLESFFKTASKGDVITYRRYNSKKEKYSQHTAVFLHITDTGIWVIDGNWGTKNITVHEITYSYLIRNLTKKPTGITISKIIP